MEAEEVVRAQLTLRAAVWDVEGIGKDETAKLDKEMGQFGICRIALEGGLRDKGKEIKYQAIRQELKRNGLEEKDALLVTEDAALAKEAYGREKAGADGNCASQYGGHGKEGRLAVVYYEKQGAQAVSEADMAVQGFWEIGVQFLDRIHKRANSLPWNILYTKRAYVREITPSDLDGLYRLYAGEGITAYIEPLFERAQEEEYTKNYIGCMYYYYGYGMWAVCDRASGRLIGRAGIERRSVQGDVLPELGYVIAKEYQGKGYATEVCKAILGYAGQELELGRVHCFIDGRNRPSIRVAEKLGFALCGHSGDGMLHYCCELGMG